jgi:hypothetical protein
VASSTTNESTPITTSTNSKTSTNHSETSEKTIAELYQNNSILSNIDLSQYVETTSKLGAGRPNIVDILSSAEVIGLNEELVSLCTKAQKSAFCKGGSEKISIYQMEKIGLQLYYQEGVQEIIKDRPKRTKKSIKKN